MAQRSEDCFACGGPRLMVDAAAAVIAERIPALPAAWTLPLGRDRCRLQRFRPSLPWWSRDHGFSVAATSIDHAPGAAPGRVLPAAACP